MPNIVRTAIKLAQASDEKARAEGGYDSDDFGDIRNPESFFYHIHEMPRKLPKLIRLLISKTPRIYQPAVSQAVFPPLAAHLCDTLEPTWRNLLGIELLPQEENVYLGRVSGKKARKERGKTAIPEARDRGESIWITII